MAKEPLKMTAGAKKLFEKKWKELRGFTENLMNTHAANSPTGLLDINDVEKEFRTAVRAGTLEEWEMR